MGKPGAKKTDKIVSVTPGDTHIILIPSPGGPVPTPIPHPCSSIIQDGVIDSVKVTGQPGAVKGSTSKHTPPHVPQGGPFQKPPANKGEIVTASSNVFYEGKEAAMLGDTAKMCADPADAPVGKVIGTAATVLIGGGGSGSDADGDLTGHGKDATGANAGTQVAPPLNQATAEGHPVDVVTGNLIAQGEDFTLEGPIPVQFVRTYSSADAGRDGTLGGGWSHNLQQRIDLLDRAHPDWAATHEPLASADNASPDERYIIYRDANGVPTTYHAPAVGAEIKDAFRRRTVRRDAGGFTLVDNFGIAQRFAPRDLSNTTYLPVETVDRNGNRVRFRYDEYARPIEIEDPYGRVLVLAYQEGRVGEIRVRIPGTVERRWCSYRYDAAGDLVEVVDRAGFRVQYGYADHLIVEERDRDDYAFYFSYDDQRRCVYTWGQDGYLTRRLDYDPKKRRTRVVNGEGEATIYRYNAFGVVCRTERGIDFYQETRHDDRGRVVSRASGGGGVAVSFTYDKAGHVAVAADGEGSEQKFVYNEFAQVTEMTDAAGAVNRYQYDARGNLRAATAPTGAVTLYEHDERGRVVRQRFPNGRDRVTSYDRFGQVSRIVEGEEVHVLQYDALGNLTSHVLPNGTTRNYEWNDQGFPVRETTNDRVTAVLEYTPGGYVSAATDAGGITRTYEYGPPGVPVTIVEYTAADGEGTTRGAMRSRAVVDVDTEGRPRVATNQLGLTYRFAYDLVGRLSRQTNPDGVTLQYAHNGAGFIESIRTSRGDVQRFEYNGRGLPTKVLYADGTKDEFEYDPMGRTIAAANRSVRLEWDYDASGQVCARRQGEFELRSEVDAAAGRVAWVSSDDFRTELVPDAQGGLGAIDFGGRTISFAAEEAPALVTRRTLPNGLVERRARDIYGRAVEDEVGAPGRPTIARRRMEYRPGGRVGVIDDSLRGGRRTFTYDDLDRLVGVAGARPERYEFDRASNLISSHRFKSADVESPDRLRRLDRRTYDYDASGRVVRISEPDRSWHLRYNVKGEVASVELPDGGTVHYDYDPLGRRIEKRFEGGARDGRRVRFVWNGRDVYKEEHLAGDDLARERFYLMFKDGPVARVDREAGAAERAIYYHNDHLGTPQFCTDDDQNIVWSYDGDSYGYEPARRGDGGEDFQSIRLPGQYLDEETGLHYNRFRYYDPASARYLQPDPIDRLTNANRFNYPLDPLGEIDPFGMAGLMVLNADPGDKTNPQGEMNMAAGVYAGHPKYPNLTGYRAPGDPPGSTGHLLDPNLGSLSNVDHLVIVAHGGPSSIQVGKPGLWAKIRRAMPWDGGYTAGSMSGKELAALLKSKGFTGKVTVVACSTGASNGKDPNFAQDLADGLGTGSEVVAWDDAVILDSKTGRATTTWNMGEAIPSISSTMTDAARGNTWGPMPESFSRWTFKPGQPPVPG